ncbi:MAG: hypothetical protein P1V97_24625 [Planctomycetota bacterium]|nr:hypothetical protein [Planctomycetota bacterium]
MNSLNPSSQEPFKTLTHFQDVRQSPSPGVRKKKLIDAAHQLRQELLDGPPVAYYRSFDLVRLPYPIQYGLRGVASSLSGFIHILNRVVVIQFQSADGIKTLLSSPSDVERNAETPFFKRLSQGFGGAFSYLEPILAPRLGTVEQALEKLKIKPEEIDYITFDHLHTQELRRWLGGDGYEKAFFPKAKLLVMRQEWESTKSLIAPQLDWYCPQALSGISEDSVMLLDGDVQLGEGIALIQTPGHTEGNHSLVVRSPEGLLVSSENGVSADCYAPHKSKHNCFRRYAKDTGMDVVLNGNTLEGGLDQYLSMILERELAGPCPQNKDFYNVVPSSEWSFKRLFSSLSPSWTFGTREFGALDQSSHSSPEAPVNEDQK